MFSEIMRYILDLGPTVMLPLVIIVFSKLLGMKLGDCFKSGLHIGIGFVGIGLVIGLMLDSIGPARKPWRNISKSISTLLTSAGRVHRP